MQTGSDRISLSIHNIAPDKIFLAKHYSTKWRNNVANSIKQQRNPINTRLVSGGGGSIIRFQGPNHYLKRKKSPKDKKNDIITINVSGNRYETRLSTLETYPNTLLGNKHKRKPYWNNEKNEYFFDRHRACFEVILYYYQSNGRLRRPDYVPLDTFLEEVAFYQLGLQAMSQINKFENVSIVKYINLPKWFWRRYIWFYLEYPQHSIFGQILYFISMLLTVLSSIGLAVETLPEYINKWDNHCQIEANISLSSSNVPTCLALFSSPFYIIQTICVSYFTIEFILRCISTPSYYRFILSIFNWIDLGAIVPYFVFLGLGLVNQEVNLNGSPFASLRILRILRFLRVLKIYLIFKQLKSLRVLSSTLKESILDFIIMIIILTLTAFLFGAATYFAEQDANGDVFDSIPKATYWGIMTITAVGYGDMYPITPIGRVLACLCAFFGVAIVGILVSVLVDRYQRVYKRKRYFPEHIISVADASDTDLDEKQVFLKRNLSGIKKTLSIGPIIPPVSALPQSSTSINRKYEKYIGSSSCVRFIISFIDDQTNNKSMLQTANELMEQLSETIKNSGEQIKLKLISSEKDSSKDQTTTTNEIFSIPEH